MEIITISGLTFSYPGSETPALSNISLGIRQGAFITLCGQSGCGKSTLLKQLKPVLTPHGDRKGEILFRGRPIEQTDRRTQTAKIGFVSQSPDHQTVTDKVWHELAFGLESLGARQQEIRLRVAEMASYFGIEGWFYKNVSELSGGQKQLLNLASVMAMQPEILVLDEPASQLDPIAAGEFLAAVGRINRDLGVTVLISEHRLAEVLPLSDRVIVLEKGRVISDGTVRQTGEFLRKTGHNLFCAMPAPMKVFAGLKSDLACPVTVREGREFLAAFSDSILKELQPELPKERGVPSVVLNGLWFKYEKDGPDILKGLSLNAYPGETFALLGGNGVGKTTALSLITGLNKAYRGQITINGEPAEKIPAQKKYNGLLGVLPQNPQALFVRKTVELDLLEMLSDQKETDGKIAAIVALCQLDSLLQRHPYDLSGGEQQRAAFAKVLLSEPKILLLDEPTKGLDAYFKQTLAEILDRLKQKGVTILMVSHDVEFCAAYADRCALFFDGQIVSEAPPRSFFSGNSFYTTAANRMAREFVPQAVTAEDVIQAFGGEDMLSKSEETAERLPELPTVPLDLLPPVPAVSTKKLPQRTVIAMILILFCVPLTLWFGQAFLDDRKYYFISLLILLETMLPFFMAFEGRRPQARRLILIAALCAIGVGGRLAFFWLPQFKPVTAVVVLAGLAFGGETGFLVGAMTAFVSNYYFGQGPWTPWQMFALGLIGFLTGVLFKNGAHKKNTAVLSVFGGLSAFAIYGTLVNTYEVFMTQARFSFEAWAAIMLSGLPFDLIHGAATFLFLFFFAEPMLEKLDRVKEKYGLDS